MAHSEADAIRGDCELKATASGLPPCQRALEMTRVNRTWVSADQTFRKSLVVVAVCLVTKSCLTFATLRDCGLPAPSVHRI